MKNTKNTRVQKQQKKAKKQRRISSTLMCGLVLSGVALPAVAVLADNAVQSQVPATTQTALSTPSTTPASDTVAKVAEQTPASTTEDKAKEAKTSDVVNDESQFANGSKDFAPDDNPYANQAPTDGYVPEDNSNKPVVQGTATIHFVDKATGNKVKEDMEVKGNSQQDIRTVAGKDAFNISGWVLIQEPNTFYPFKEGHTEYTAYYTADESQETKYALGADGYYHWIEADGSLNQVNRFVDATITYTDAKTGDVLGTDTQIKADANALVISSTVGHEFDANTWGIAEGASEWIDPNSAMQVGDKTFYSNLMIFTDPEISANNGNGKVVTPQNGNINLTVPLTNMTETPEEDYVDFSIRYVDEDGKDLAPVESEHLTVGSSIDVVAKDFSMQGYKLKDGEKTEVQQTVTKGMGDIVFHYEEDKETYSKLQFKFVDSKTGKEIKKAYTETSLPDGAYVIDPTKDDFKVDGYKLQSKYYENEDTSSVIYTFPAKGKTTTVELKYDADSKPDPVKQGSVTFKYVDKDSKELKAPKTVKGDVDSKFSEKAPTIEGYTLDTTKSDETKTGTFTKAGQTYYFVYNKDNKPAPKTSKITVKLVDKDTGKEIKASKTIEGEVGTQKFAMSDPYFSTAPDGYSLTDNVMNAVFQFADKDTTVELKYAKNDTPDPVKQGSVTVSYVDESGKSIQDSKTIKGDVGSDFSEKAPTIKGYTLTSDSTLTGKYTEDAQSIKFTYKKDATPAPDPVKQGTINFKLVDESGKELKALYVSQNEVGTSIKVTDSDYFHIDGYQIKSGAKEYTYTDKVQTVTITYSKVENNDNGGNTDNNGNSTDNNGDNTNNTDNGNKTNTNGDSTSANKNSSSKSEVKPLVTETAKENKATLPTTGEAHTLWLFLSGLGVLLATGLALVFKRKHN